MWIEWWILKEQEQKISKLSTEQKIKEDNKVTEYKKVKEKVSVEIEAERKLDNLKELISKWVISKETAQKVSDWVDIDNSVITSIFDKISQIEETKDIDNYLPAELRITKQQYIKAMNDEIFRLQMITKLNSALILLSTKVVPNSVAWLNLFTGFLTILDKNLIIIQENTIDLRNSLEDIDKNKIQKKVDNRSIWRKIMDFIKEVLTN